MAKKGAKATKKFAKSGQLKNTIDARRKHQKVKKQIQARKSVRGAPVARGPAAEDDNDEVVDDDPSSRKKNKGKGRAKAVDFLDEDEQSADEKDAPVAGKGKFSGMSVDDLLSGKFMDDDDDEEDEEGGSNDEDDDFSSVDDLEDDEAAHKLELAALAEKDPEFYKYLQQNDKELLNFTVPVAAEGDDDSDDGGFALNGEEDEDMESGDEEEIPVLTSEILKGWQKAILETRSLRALRKLLVAFRSAARMNEDEESTSTGGWKIEEASVFNKLVVTAFKYTPVVLEHHIPYKTLPGGKFKPPPQNAKFKALQKLILSFFLNVVRFVSELSDPQMQQLAITESARLIPYVVSSRKAIRNYLKLCFDLWSSAEDSVRLSALLALRMLVGSQDESVVDLVLRGSYMTLVKSCKVTTAHTIPSINLMKNSAAELYSTDQSAAYQHAFGFIRQLAVHLRGSMKVKSKEAYKQVYNWQFVHSIDFWSMVLAKACDATAEDESGQESELKPLIYPLIQIAIGAIKLIPTAKYYPLHLQIIRSLQHLIQHTRTYLNLTPFLLPIITSTLSPTSSSKSKSATLRPLDMTLHIRAPAQYLKSRVYAESTAEEALFLFGAWAECMQGSVAFPEVVFPGTVMLKKALKKANSGGGGGKNSGNGKITSQVKTLLERVEEGVRWVSAKRDNIVFASSNQDQVEQWEREVKIEDTPMGKWMRVQRKAREKKQALLDKARQGEGEILEEDD